jgi:hypothetical protein
MSTIGKLGGCTALVGFPVLAGVLWVVSGREVFSKSGKAVQVALADPLFGDTTSRTEFRPGPVLGYYIGLDLVVAVALLAITIGVIWWFVARRRARSVRPDGGTNP